MRRELRKIITIKLLHWAINICPKGRFNYSLSKFIINHIDELDE